MGESFGAWQIEPGERVLGHVSSVNLACGYHAGDPLVMERTVARCKQHGVAVGAHPGYPDLMGFGRREMQLSPAEARAYVIYQVGALKAFCEAAGVPLQHVKLHGAFYNAASDDERLASAVIEALLALRSWGLIVLARSGSLFARRAREAGLTVAEEVFADRAYNPDGTLVSRRLPGAVLHDPAEVARRAVQMATQGWVAAVDGTPVRLQVDSICVHGDNPEAAASVERMARELRAAGVRIAPLREVAGREPAGR
ncbi:MAG: LamB/YcsF family protein [Limnochordaceae bacterium]|nr:LamB/YcsF family protein [Limnochordaceae bacterium]